MDLFYCVLAFAGCGFIGAALAVRSLIFAMERRIESSLDITPRIYEEPDPE